MATVVVWPLQILMIVKVVPVNMTASVGTILVGTHVLVLLAGGEGTAKQVSELTITPLLSRYVLDTKLYEI